MREPKLDREAQDIFNAEAEAVIPECNANIFPQMLASNKIIELTISEKIKELQDEQNKQSAPKIEPKLDAYLCDENYKTFFDEENVFRKWHLSLSKKYSMMYAKKRKLSKYKRIAHEKSRAKTTI